MYRLASIAIVLLWISAMSALFVRDVYPAWTAQDAPPMTKDQLLRLDQRTQQLGIFDKDGQRRGTAWSDVSLSGGNSNIRGTVYLEGFSLVPVVLVETSTEYDQHGELDSFNLDVFGVPLTIIRVHGERHGIYFPCEIQVGPLFRQANLEMAASRLLGDSFRPFSYLPTLKVGQSWRMQVVDPLSAVMGGSPRFVPVVARVSGKETITHRGKPVECFVVETSPGQAKAWVEPDGRVCVQQVEMPGFGRMTVRDEAYNDRDRIQARHRVRHGRSGDDDNGVSMQQNVSPMRLLKKSISKVLEGAGHDGHN